MNKSESTSFEETLSRSLKENFAGTPKLLVGVSGGPDSMALLYGLYKLEIEVVGVHINYGLRGKESDLDQELAEEMCFEWGYECYSVQLDSGEAKGGNFQNRARNERYRIFRELKEECNADAIAIAHHRDDQVETILQKLFRGSAPDAWQGMKVFENDVFRPLLMLSKEEILKYCEYNAVPYRVDGSNMESNYARNFIRNEFKEKLDSFFPGWQDNILTLTSFGSMNSKAIEFITQSLSSESELELGAFGKLETDLRLSVLKNFIEKNVENVTLSKGLLSEIAGLTDSQPGSVIPVKDGIEMLRERDSILIKNRTTTDDINAEQISELQIRDGYQTKELSFRVKEGKSFSPDFLTVDAGKLEFPMSLGKWQEGDRFRPLGMSGSQKISDHLANRKVRSSEKEKALILSGADGTIYALIFPFAPGNGQLGTISELVKCTDETRMLLEIKYRHPE